MHMTEYSVGIFVGALLALGLWLLYAKRTGAFRQKDDYDERQVGMQGAGYKIAYSITMIGLLVLGSLPIFVEGVSGFWLSLGAMGLLFGSVSVYAVYCIAKGAFLGLRQRWKSYLVIYIVVVLGNLVSFLVNRTNMANGSLVTNDMTTYTLYINLMIVSSFSVVLVALLLGRYQEGKESREAEDA